MMAPMHPLLTTTLPVVMQPMVPKMDTGSGMYTLRLGASLRDRATLPSPLRGLGPSGGYPSRLRSLRSLRAPLARRLAALPAVAGPTRSALRSTESSGQPSGPPRDGAARHARRGARLARPGRLGRQRASPRLVAAALRAPPVSASPFTGLRTASCTGARTSADTAARACLPVLRTTPRSSRCTSRRSSAAAAPTSRCRRPRFPER